MSRDAATHPATNAAQPSAASAASAAVLDDACCFDCGAACAHDRWLCATHNVSLCIVCAGLHRALGAGISFVRSERLDGCDTTSDNAAFSAFLEAHGVTRRDWLAAGRVSRYFTPVCDLWRRRSDATARLRAVEPPDPELVKVRGREIACDMDTGQRRAYVPIVSAQVLVLLSAPPLPRLRALRLL